MDRLRNSYGTVDWTAYGTVTGQSTALPITGPGTFSIGYWAVDWTAFGTITECFVGPRMGPSLYGSVDWTAYGTAIDGTAPTRPPMYGTFD